MTKLWLCINGPEYRPVIGIDWLHATGALIWGNQGGVIFVPKIPAASKTYGWEKTLALKVRRRGS